MSTRYAAYETNVDVSVVCRNVKHQNVILATGQVRDIILVQKSKIFYYSHGSKQL